MRLGTLASRHPPASPTGVMRLPAACRDCISLLHSWQKPRFLPAETKLMSEKAPQATFSNELESCVIALAGANPQNAQNVRDEYLPVADLSGLRRPDDGFHDLVDQFVLHRHFDAGLRHEIDHVFRTAIKFRMAALSAEALDLGHRHARHPNFRERGADVVQFEGFDDGSD